MTQIGTNSIIAYLKKNYAPLSIILYGSYADGSQNEHSDFDALLICENHAPFHDVSIVSGIQLDVFIYDRHDLAGTVDYANFVQIFDGQILMDTDNIAQSLQNHVLAYFQHLPKKSAEELQNDVCWCKKMVLRAERNDTEGFFRWHWVLIDSLEIFCDILHVPYRGPKKSLRWMKAHDTDAFSLYSTALSSLDIHALRRWIDCLESQLHKA